MFAAAASILFAALLVSANRSLSNKRGILSVNSTLTNSTVAEVQTQQKHVFPNDAVDHSSGHSLSKRQTYVGCSSDQQEKIEGAITVAQNYATRSFRHLKSNPDNFDLYTKWFGTYDLERYQRVMESFSRLRIAPSSWEYMCDCPYEDVDYLLRSDQYQKITLCAGFWALPEGGVHSKPYSLIRGGTQFQEIYGTIEQTIGIDLALLLTDRPRAAVLNP
ncbi:peptidyl-lys metalloendopeptidase, partial [Rhizoctonia solani 123E]